MAQSAPTGIEGRLGGSVGNVTGTRGIFSVSSSLPPASEDVEGGPSEPTLTYSQSKWRSIHRLHIFPGRSPVGSHWTNTMSVVSRQAG